MTGPHRIGPLAVEADLRLEVDGAAVTIAADGDVVDVEIGGAVSAVAWALAAVPGTRRRLRRRLAAAADRLDAVGLTVVVASSGRPLARIGRRAEPGRVTARLMGSPRIELTGIATWSAVVAATRGRRPVTDAWIEPGVLPDDRARRLASTALSDDRLGVTHRRGRAVEDHIVEVGRGSADFALLRDRLLGWQVHTRAGLHVAVDRPRVAAGAHVVLAYGPGRLALPAPCRVVWVVDEPEHAGYGLGTLTGHPERGEEGFLLDLDADDVVRLTVLSAAEPATWWARAGAPVTELVRRRIVRRYLHSL